MRRFADLPQQLHGGSQRLAMLEQLTHVVHIAVLDQVDHDLSGQRNGFLGVEDLGPEPPESIVIGQPEDQLDQDVTGLDRQLIVVAGGDAAGLIPAVGANKFDLIKQRIDGLKDTPGGGVLFSARERSKVRK